jgi:hypothetical protein
MIDPESGRRIKGPRRPYGGGVSFHARDKVWQSYITVDGDRRRLGYYDKKEDALRARQKAIEQWDKEHST